ncbi:MAG: tetratricopeptide repeat protein [Crocinitomicaceae bacterium]
MRLLLFTLLLSSLSVSAHAQDSLLTALKVDEKIKSSTDLKDTVVIDQLKKSFDKLKYNEPGLTVLYARKMLALARKLKFEPRIGSGLRLLSGALMGHNQLDSSIIYADRAIDYCKRYNLEEELMKAYNNRGNACFYKSEYEKALEYYYKADEMAKEKFPKAIAGSANGIGLIFRVIENYNKSKEYFEEAYRLGKIYKDTADVLQALNNLGIIAKNQGEYEKSLAYYNEGLELAKANNNLRREGELLYNAAIVYNYLGESDKMMEAMEKSTEITYQIGTDRGIAIDNYSLALYYTDLNQLKKAEEKMLIALDYGQRAEYSELIAESYIAMAEIQSKLRNYKEAFTFMAMGHEYSDSLGLADANSAATRLENEVNQARIEAQDSLQREQEVLENQHKEQLAAEKLKSREILLWSSGVVIILVVVALYFMFRSRSQLQSKNKIITDRNNQIETQKEELIEQHKEIRDSINYAKRIQTALLSGNEEWDKISLDHFILFKPKDVVSGDFYWAHHFPEENISIWVTADCTGHGVPGAFMSMLGIGFLNEIVIENGIKSGPIILNKLRDKIIHALTQKSEAQQQKDGMDLALCIWDRKTNLLEFTGANNPLWVLRKKSQISQSDFAKIHLEEDQEFGIIEIASNKMPVGFHTGELAAFKSQTIQLEIDDRVITFTDGFADQFGGDKGKKLKYKPFKSMLIKAQAKPIKIQSDILDSEFSEWIRDFEQIDDICVIGVKV